MGQGQNVSVPDDINRSLFIKRNCIPDRPIIAKSGGDGEVFADFIFVANLVDQSGINDALPGMKQCITLIFELAADGQIIDLRIISDHGEDISKVILEC